MLKTLIITFLVIVVVIIALVLLFVGLISWAVGNAEERGDLNFRDRDDWRLAPDVLGDQPYIQPDYRPRDMHQDPQKRWPDDQRTEPRGA